MNEGVEEAARVCAALAGAIGKEGIVVDRTTYGQYGRCSLSKSSFRAFGGMAVLGLSSVVRLARGVEIIAQSPSRLWHKVQCKSEASLRRSGVTLPRGPHISDNDARRVGVLVWVVLLLRPEGRRGVRGKGWSGSGRMSLRVRRRRPGRGKEKESRTGVRVAQTTRETSRTMT